MGTTNGHNTRSLYFPERLKHALDAFLEYPLILVEAPMGYGKTTYVRERLKRLEGCEVLWQKVLDENPSGFWKGFCRQLGMVAPEAAEALEALGLPTDSTTRHAALELLEAVRFQKGTVLVVDDYHMAASPEVNEWVRFLVKLELPRFHMVLIARHAGLMDTAELALKGQLLHLRKEAFEFAPKDIQRYYRQCGVPLKEAEAQRLFGVTEGWVSALYLLLLDRQEKDSLGLQQDISRLMEHAIYRHLSEEMKALLLRLCTFEGFSLEQAVFISGNPRAEVLLDEMVDRKSFVRYDSDNRIYLIHNLFMNFLQDQLERTGLLPEIRHRAARWYLQDGDFGRALRYFHECGDYEGMYATFIQERQSGINYTYDRELLIRAFTECPPEIRRKHPMALLVLAFEFYSIHEVERFQSACGLIAEVLETEAALEPEERDRLTGEFQLLLSFTQYNDIRKMSEHHKAAGALLREPSLLLPKRGIWTFGSPSILYMFHREAGGLADSVEAMFEALPFYSKATGGNASGGENVLRAEVALYAGEYEHALIDSHQALKRAEAQDQVSNILGALFVQARVALMTGDPDQAMTLLKEMHRRVVVSKEYVYLHTVEACEGYCFGVMGLGHRIPQWLKAGDLQSDRLMFPSFALFNIIHGRALLLEGEYHRLLGCQESFLEIASVFPNLLGQIHTWIHSAAAYRRLLRDREAAQALKQALDLALPDMLLLPFVENCDHLAPLLEALRGEETYRPAAERILVLYGQGFGRPSGASGIPPESRPGLTEREKEIAGLAAGGLSNREIGERLFITQNTVKTQLKRVFEKLDISSRAMLTQALQENQ